MPQRGVDEVKIRWGILGCAGIAGRSVIPAIARSETGKLGAIASRNGKRAQEFAERFGFPQYYGSYHEMLADADIDAIYIPLPNHMHKEWTIRAAEAGKHVLCEKPLALTADEAREMGIACEGSGVLLAEAFMYRYHPRYDRVRAIIASGEIGEIRGIQGVFTFNNADDLANFRFKPGMGGGALYDVGCYPINAARLLLGSEPVAASAVAQYSERHGGVDMQFSGLLEFDKDIALTFQCGMWTAFRNSLEIAGSAGRIDIPYAFTYRDPANAHIYIETAGDRREETVPQVNAYTEQIDHIGRCLLEGTPLRFPAADAVANMRAIDACLSAAGRRERVLIPPE